ncbi:unnamed protein product, partial [Bubo scandiacus]
ALWSPALVPMSLWLPMAHGVSPGKGSFWQEAPTPGSLAMSAIHRREPVLRLCLWQGELLKLWLQLLLCCLALISSGKLCEAGLGQMITKGGQI